MADFAEVLHITLDFVGVGMLMAFLVISLRIYGILKNHSELDNIRFLWQPIVVGGFFFCSWAVLDLLSDLLGFSQVVSGLLLSLSPIAGAVAFIIALKRLYTIWSSYDRQLKTIKRNFDEIVDKSH